MLDSVGSLVDALCIENIKIAVMKEKLNEKGLKKNDREYVETYEKMMTLNTNRSIIAKELDAKLDRVIRGEKNSILKSIKTYG
jgi:hypothetical protein